MHRPRVLFVYDHKYPHLWRDGLWAALKLLEREMDFTWCNLQVERDLMYAFGDKLTNKRSLYDFVLGWGGFNSSVEKLMVQLPVQVPQGLCIAGNAFPPTGSDRYAVLFYETDWYRPQIDGHPNIVHAFGVNTDIYNALPESPQVWDWLSVGSFSLWKRQKKMLELSGTRFVVGEIQRDNWLESFDIISDLLLGGVAVSDMVYPTVLRDIYNSARGVYIPADVYGGGERSVLEARACGRPVKVEEDNPKLQELLNSPVWDHKYYAESLKKGIMSVI